MIAQRLQTFSMAEIPLAPQTAPVAVLSEQGPQLHVVEHSKSYGSVAPTAKKSLDFRQSGKAVEPIVVYNTAVQTPLPAAPTTPSGATGGTEAGTSLQQ